jgi:hypothetical protein
MLAATVIVGGEPSHATFVWNHAAPDGGFAAAGRIDAAARRNQSGRRKGVEEGYLINSFEMGQIMAF